MDTMEQRRLGRGGPEISTLGLGCNNFGWTIDAEAAREVVDAALAAGVSFFDTADVYGGTNSEVFLAQALRGRRDGVVVQTKFGHPVPGAPEVPHGTREYVRWAVDGSLRRLECDCLDVLMLHTLDKKTPLAETIGHMAELVREGKARYLGVSNVGPAELGEAVETARREGAELVAVENRLSLLHAGDEVELLPLCERLGVGYVAYYPLESGALTGKYRRNEPLAADSRFVKGPQIWNPEKWLTDEVFDRIEILEAFAAEQGASLLELALGSLFALPGVATAIAGATRPEQVAENAKAARWRPAAAALAALPRWSG